MRILASLFAAVWLFGYGHTLAAQPQDSDAEQGSEGETSAYSAAIAEAVREFSAGRFEEARVLFKRAHGLSPSARTLRGLGMTAFELRLYVDAMHELEAALREQRKPLTQEQRQQAQSLIERSRQYVGRVRLDLEPEGAQPLVDGQEPEYDAEQAILMDVGVHSISATAQGYKPASLRLRVEGGSDQTVRLALEPIGAADKEPPREPAEAVAAAEPRPEPQERDRTLGTLGWISLGAAAVFGGVSAGFWLRGDGLYEDAQDPEAGCSPSCTDDEVSDIETSDLLTNVFLGLAVASGAASVVLLTLDATGGDEPGERQQVTLRARPTGLELRGAF